MALRKSLRERALAVVVEMDAHAVKWAGERDAALSELAALELRVGDDALADPVAAAGLPRRMQELRDRVSVAGRAVDAAAGKALAARRDAVRCEADEMQPQVDAARAAVEEHERNAAKLLRALEDFSGQEYLPRTSHDDLAEQEMFQTGTVTLLIPKILALRDDLARVEIARDLLRASAEGRDLRSAVPAAFEIDPWTGPVFRFVDLPASLHPTRGLIPAVEFVDPQEQAEERAHQARADVAEYQGKVDAFDAELVSLAEEVKATEFVARKREIKLQIDEVEKGRGCAMRDVARCVEQLTALDAAGRVLTPAA